VLLGFGWRHRELLWGLSSPGETWLRGAARSMQGGWPWVLQGQAPNDGPAARQMKDIGHGDAEWAHDRILPLTNPTGP
jgi:hypothetical protein